MYTVAGGRCPSASCGRSVLYSLRNASKARCCSLRFERGGLAVSAFSVRCIRSCLPFCCGRPGWIRSGRMPSLIHQMAKWESPAGAQEAKGGPLSVRMASGSPYSRKADSKMGCTTRAVVRSRPSHRRRNRLKPSEMVSVCTAHPEVPLEVGAPDGVRSVVAKERSRVWRCSAPSGAAGHHQATPAENPRHRAARRKIQSRVLRRQGQEQFLGTPERMASSGTHDELGHFLRDSGGMAVRSTRPVKKRSRAIGGVALDPLVARLPADA